MPKYQQEILQAQCDSHGILRPVTAPVVDAVRCIHCRTLHEVGAETYFTLSGNLTVGGENGGGILGNGDWEGLGIPVYNFCIDAECLSSYAKGLEEEAFRRKVKSQAPTKLTGGTENE